MKNLKLTGITPQPILNIDATPDENYPLRILRTYRANCNCRWSDTKYPDLDTIDPILVLMNKHQEQRALLLDKAIDILKKARL